MKHTAMLAGVGLIGLAGIALAGPFELTRSTVDGGGAQQTGTFFSLSGTIGQPDTGVQQGASFALSGGFWASTEGLFPFCEPSLFCPDLDGSGQIDTVDLGILLGDFGCVTATAGFCAADINCDGQVDTIDLGVLLGDFGLSCEPPVITGACCITEVNGDGETCRRCDIIEEADCIDAGGLWTGPDTSCFDCPEWGEFAGACCFGEGECIITDFLSCELNSCSTGSGVFQGVGVTCAAAGCPEQLGACCRFDIDELETWCTLGYVERCTTDFGSVFLAWNGAGSDCESCFELGACSITTGPEPLCIQTTEVECAFLFGFWEGPGTEECP